MVQRGVPIPVIKEWLGHKTIQMTMRYAVLAPTNLMAAVSALEPAPIGHNGGPAMAKEAA